MMDGEPARNLEAEPLRLARAIRFAFVAIVIAACIPSLHASLSIGKFMAVLSDMFGGRGELPLITKMVFNARPAFWFISIVVPVGAFATLRMRDVTQSFYFLGALVFVTTVQFVILYYSITAPLAALAMALTFLRGNRRESPHVGCHVSPPRRTHRSARRRSAAAPP